MTQRRLTLRRQYLQTNFLSSQVRTNQECQGGRVVLISVQYQHDELLFNLGRYI